MRKKKDSFFLKREEWSATWLRTAVKAWVKVSPHHNYNVLKRRSDTMTENGDCFGIGAGLLTAYKCGPNGLDNEKEKSRRQRTMNKPIRCWVLERKYGKKKEWAIILINGLHTHTHMYNAQREFQVTLFFFFFPSSNVSRYLSRGRITSYQGTRRRAVSR